MIVGRHIRQIIYRWHCFIARAESATRAYISLLSAIARVMPEGRVRDLLEWALTGQSVQWPPIAFAPRLVTVGCRTLIRVTPHLGEFDQAALFRRRLDYEASVFMWLEQQAPRRYDAVIDIGANVGIYSVFFEALICQNPAGRLRRVYAFEPSREAYGRLVANLRANNARSVECFAAAVSDEGGLVRFYEPDGHLTNGSLSPSFAGMFSPTVGERFVVSIGGSQLADLFARHQQVLLKIDAEGSEPRILAAMASILDRYSPDILIEVLQGAEDEINRIGCLAGYTFFHLAPDGASKHRKIAADRLARDWLLTKSSLRDEISS